MKFHNLCIDTKGSFEVYQKITNFLDVNPKKEEDFQIWTYQVVTYEEEEYFDYINAFLDLLEPNFEKLKDLNIYQEDITIWLFYEYEKQCSMSFNPQETKRLGESGISLNIDCIKRN
ncbi:hypothetical protein [Flavobacterium sp. LC2016-01]|uniref:hypothetical protein n=1 Tax=Flavobacterium sp. LC2016-01 TaxID=2675876 RepID=UPI0012BAE580|nr:hypothetical protein [Flavobacterium sp. LC2016-01]MTH14648.1 hypothetical protein [Flavobacterium sp. LC2016-01]